MNRGKRILLVGSGLTSALVTKLLQENFDIFVWEKSDCIGGRFYTVTTAFNSSSKDSLMIDFGAQYITTTSNNSENIIYKTLLENKILIPMGNNRIKGLKVSSDLDELNFISPCGMKSVVKYLFSNKVNIYCNRKLCELQINEENCLAISDTETDFFDIVVLTMPVPEILKYIKMNTQNPSNHSLENVKYSSRYALGLIFNKSVCTEYDAEYINDNDILRFVAYDSWRSNKSVFRSAVMHTTIKFGELYFDYENTDEIKNLMLTEVKKLYPHWPEPQQTLLHQWKYSQVLSPYDSKPGAVLLSEKPLIIAGGDGFIGSNFDCCLVSANKIVDLILNHL